MSAIFGAIGVIISFFMFWVTCLSRCLSCCRCRCCGKRPKTRQSCINPTALLVVFTAGIVAVGALCISYEQKLHEALVGSGGSADSGAQQTAGRPTPTPASPIPANVIAGFQINPDTNMLEIINTMYSEVDYRFDALSAALQNITQSVSPITTGIVSVPPLPPNFSYLML